MAGHRGREGVVRQGLAHGARGGRAAGIGAGVELVEGAGEEAVGAEVAGGDLEEQGVDAEAEGG